MDKKYNFDEIIDRKGTGSLKTDVLVQRYGRSDLIPLWVADMDFRTPDFIIDAIRERCNHEIFGYPVPPAGYWDSILNWLDSMHQWKIPEDSIRFIPGVVKGIAFAVMHFTSPGDSVIIQPPVYHPFRIVPEMHQRKIVNNYLRLEDGRYKMDLEDLRRKITPDCKMLILCNPHNPVGICWDKETLIELAAICYEHNILVVSDEIHSDLALFGNKHIPFATVSEKAKQVALTFMAPSKTFNIAGIVSSFVILENEEYKESFFRFLSSSELDEGHIFAYTATRAAYEHGKDWLRQMKEYIEGNILFVDEYVRENIPEIKIFIPEASFLLWLDCRLLGMSQPELEDLFVNKAKLALNTGRMFGINGEGFMRMNIGTSKDTLAIALKQLKEALK